MATQLIYRYIIVTARIARIETTPTHLAIHFEDPAAQPSINVPYMLTIPDKMTPSEHASPVLTSGIFGDKHLSPFWTIPDADGADATMPMSRMGDSPKTPVKGLFWAGNSGSFVANVALSVAQGMNAGVTAGDQLGTEDVERMVKAAELQK